MREGSNEKRERQFPRNIAFFNIAVSFCAFLILSIVSFAGTAREYCPAPAVGALQHRRHPEQPGVAVRGRAAALRGRRRFGENQVHRRGGLANVRRRTEGADGVREQPEAQRRRSPARDRAQRPRRPARPVHGLRARPLHDVTYRSRVSRPPRK